MQINGKAIKHILLDKSMRQTELSEKAGITRATISAICNGKSCSNETAQKIAKALDVKIEELTNK